MAKIEYTMTAIILLSAIVFLTRALPFVFSNVMRKNEWIQFLGKQLPISIIFLLALYYAFSMAQPTQWHIIPFQIIGILVTLLVHWKWKNTTISLILGTLAYLAMTTFF